MGRHTSMPTPDGASGLVEASVGVAPERLGDDPELGGFQP